MRSYICIPSSFHLITSTSPSSVSFSTLLLPYFLTVSYEMSDPISNPKNKASPSYRPPGTGTVLDLVRPTIGQECWSITNNPWNELRTEAVLLQTRPKLKLLAPPFANTTMSMLLCSLTLAKRLLLFAARVVGTGKRTSRRGIAVCSLCMRMARALLVLSAGLRAGRAAMPM